MEGDAGTSQLNLADQQDPHTTEPQAEAVTEIADPTSAPTPRRRLSRNHVLLGWAAGWMAAILAGLLVLAAAVGVGGYLALRAHQDSERIAGDEAEALAAAKDCVTATQATRYAGDDRGPDQDHRMRDR